MTETFYFVAYATVLQAQKHNTFELRSGIVAHMFNISNLLCGLGSDGHQNYLYGRYDNIVLPDKDWYGY